jgi:small GTP-binding protein
MDGLIPPATGPDGTPPDGPAPVVAVVGRPNVGKSTLVNRILGSRQAVVQDVPGVTRDRVTYDANWRGRAFTLVDTGGWEPAVEGTASRAARVAAQARVAVDAADAVLFVVDAVVGVTDADDAVAAVLRRSGKPVVLAANKVDDAPGSPPPPRCGRSAWASPARSARCTGAAAVTCSTLCSARFLRPRPSRWARRAARAGWP